jgi:protein-S-isoprenylcysteine O-methyltransferase Ste14
MADDARLPVRALVGTIVFVALLPATVIVLGPYWITGWRSATRFSTSLTRWLGVILIVVALPVFVGFLGRFVFEGRGTPSPTAPTERLVVGGPFRGVRNPGYVAVDAMLIGQGLVFASPAVLAYAVLIAFAFHIFVLVYEEPTLRDTYGAEYDEYCRRVSRWIPRPPASR